MRYTCGVDIVDVARIRRAAARGRSRFLQRVFSARELAYCRKQRDPYPHLAARFAVKEAVMKALGDTDAYRVQWKEIQVVNDNFGKPSVDFLGRSAAVVKRRRIQHLDVSISHTKTLAVAVATMISRA